MPVQSMGLIFRNLFNSIRVSTIGRDATDIIVTLKEQCRIIYKVQCRTVQCKVRFTYLNIRTKTKQTNKKGQLSGTPKTQDASTCSRSAKSSVCQQKERNLPHISGEDADHPQLQGRVPDIPTLVGECSAYPQPLKPWMGKHLTPSPEKGACYQETPRMTQGNPPSAADNLTA